MALALAFCKHSKVGEYLNSCKNALCNLTGRDKGSHTKKKTTTTWLEGEVLTQQRVCSRFSQENILLDLSDHNYSCSSWTQNPKEEQARTIARTVGRTRKL